MYKITAYIRANFSFLAISAFWLFALLNPVFKKYDYVAGFPLVILFGVIILFLALKEFDNKREKVILEPLFLVIFFLSISVSFLLSQVKNYGLSEVMAFSAMVPFYLLYAHKRNDWTEKFTKIITVGLFLSVILGFIFYFFYADFRAFGPFFNVLYHANKWPNAFALFMLMSWPILLIAHKGKFTFLRIVGLALVLGMFLLIYSRGGMIVLGGQLILLAIYYFKQISLKTVLVFLAVVALAIGVFDISNSVREFQYKNLNLEDKVSFENGEALTSVQERKDFWKGAIKLIKEKPVFGWGPFSFRYAYNPIQETFLGNSDHPHNIFLKIGAENGLIALSSFAAFLGTVFWTVARRFKKLAKARKDTSYLIFVALAGAFAHSLIDYNFNFIANLLLLFTLLVMLRSTVVKKDTIERKSFPSLAIAIIIVVFALYEGFVLIASQTINYSFLSYSFYPRNYYINIAEKQIENNNFGGAMDALDYDKNLSSLNAENEYLEGKIYCDKDFQSYNVLACKTNFAEALVLNPMNDFSYYRDYISLLTPNNLSPNDIAIIGKATKLLTDYFGYVKMNIHFTAYTENVEAAYEMAQFLATYLPPEEAAIILNKSNKMMSTANSLRSMKSF